MISYIFISMIKKKTTWVQGNTKTCLMKTEINNLQHKCYFHCLWLWILYMTIFGILNKDSQIINTNIKTNYLHKL